MRLYESIREQFEKSFSGVAPDCECTIPTFLTPQLAYEIHREILMWKAAKVNDRIKELSQQGEELSFSNPKMVKILTELRMDRGK